MLPAVLRTATSAVLALPRLVMRGVNLLVERQLAAPIPVHWLPVIERQVPAIQPLTGEQKARLLQGVRQLIRACRWEGCGGLTLTEDMQLVVAAQACLLTLELPGEPYPRLKRVLIYPRSFLPQRHHDLGLPVTSSTPGVPTLGEAWTNGSIVLAWDEAMAGSADPADGQNVVFHEFAHQLDFQHSLVPNSFSEMQPTVDDPEAWQRALHEGYERRCGLEGHDADDVLSSYATTNEAEFFACATEAFFERPQALRTEYAAFYEQLRQLYRQDPAVPPRSEGSQPTNPSAGVA